MMRQSQLSSNSLWEFHVGNIHAEASWMVALQALQLAMQTSTWVIFMVRLFSILPETMIR